MKLYRLDRDTEQHGYAAYIEAPSLDIALAVNNHVYPKIPINSIYEVEKVAEKDKPYILYKMDGSYLFCAEFDSNLIQTGLVTSGSDHHEVPNSCLIHKTKERQYEQV